MKKTFINLEITKELVKIHSERNTQAIKVHSTITIKTLSSTTGT